MIAPLLYLRMFLPLPAAGATDFQLISLSARKRNTVLPSKTSFPLCLNKTFSIRKEHTMFYTWLPACFLLNHLLFLYPIGSSITIITYYRLRHLNVHVKTNENPNRDVFHRPLT